MKEKQLQTIEIEDVDGDIDDDTVMRFIEFAYSGDYTVPDPDVLQLPTDLDKKKKKSVDAESTVSSSSLAEPLPEPELEEDHRMKRTPGPALQIANLTRQKQWNQFCSEVYVVQHAWEPEANDEREDYTTVFLCHARLYKFADRYDCENLMVLVLQKLRLTLSCYIFYKERASAVVELVRYTYTHTLDSDQGYDGLKTLVLEYATCYFRELMQDLSFVQLLQEGGSLPSDLMAKVAEMIS